MYFSSDEQRWINRIHKLAAEHPDEVRILAEPSTNDGCIYASLPIRWLKLSPPRQMSDEYKESCAERMAAMRSRRKKEG